ncbi:Reticulon [Artemisia annua]|uniref:Reticulon n=1 Tax=Artemisia annua TaxID=35608 RepID=A0A2U1L9A8_ARTAN|nr:Reticulon [Artemisia annua]
MFVLVNDLISQDTANSLFACLANIVGATESVLTVAATGHDKRLFLKGISLDYVRWKEHSEVSDGEDDVDDGEDDTLIDESDDDINDVDDGEDDTLIDKSDDDISDNDLGDMLDDIGQRDRGLSTVREHTVVSGGVHGPGKGVLKRLGLQKSSTNHRDSVTQTQATTVANDVPSTFFSKPAASEKASLDSSLRIRDEDSPVRERAKPFSHNPSILRGGSKKRTRNEDLEDHLEVNSPLTDVRINDLEVNSPLTDIHTNDRQSEEHIGSTSNGTTVPCKETRALSAAKRSRLNNRKLVFEVDDCAGRIVGDDSQVFITKGGCLVREHAKFDGTTWRKQEPSLKTDIIAKCVTYPNKEQALMNPPRGVKVPDWVLLCDRFASEDFQKISTRNKLNPSKNEIPPANGTKSMARETHMRDLQNEEANSSSTPAEICIQKLGYILGHLKGRSASKRNILANESLQRELQLEKEKTEKLQIYINKMEKKPNKMERKHNNLKQKVDYLMKHLPHLSEWQSQAPFCHPHLLASKVWNNGNISNE